MTAALTAKNNRYLLRRPIPSRAFFRLDLIFPGLTIPNNFVIMRLIANKQYYNAQLSILLTFHREAGMQWRQSFTVRCSVKELNAQK